MAGCSKTGFSECSALAYRSTCGAGLSGSNIAVEVSPNVFRGSVAGRRKLDSEELNRAEDYTGALWRSGCRIQPDASRSHLPGKWPRVHHKQHSWRDAALTSSSPS